MKTLTMILLYLCLNGCDRCGISDACFDRRIREEFIRLSPDAREKERQKQMEFNMKTHGIKAYLTTYKEPTPEELTKLKNEKK